MKKEKSFTPSTTIDMKVYLLFLLDSIGYIMDHDTIMEIVQESTDEISFDYAECLRQLAESEHLLSDEVDGVRYYEISDKGRMVAAELYDTLDKSFRERSLKKAIRHISLSKSGARINAYITETENKRYRVTMEAFDKFGEVMSTSLTVNSRAEAETMKRNYETKPDGLYRGVLFSATGKLEFISK